MCDSQAGAKLSCTLLNLLKTNQHPRFQLILVFNSKIFFLLEGRGRGLKKQQTNRMQVCTGFRLTRAVRCLSIYSNDSVG